MRFTRWTSSATATLTTPRLKLYFISCLTSSPSWESLQEFPNGIQRHVSPQESGNKTCQLQNFQALWFSCQTQVLESTAQTLIPLHLNSTWVLTINTSPSQKSVELRSWAPLRSYRSSWTGPGHALAVAAFTGSTINAYLSSEMVLLKLVPKAVNTTCTVYKSKLSQRHISNIYGSVDLEIIPSLYQISVCSQLPGTIATFQITKKKGTQKILANSTMDKSSNKLSVEYLYVACFYDGLTYLQNNMVDFRFTNR